MNSNQVEVCVASPGRKCTKKIKISSTDHNMDMVNKSLTPTAPPEHLFDTKETQVDYRKEPSAPLDYMVGIRPDWLPLDITVEQLFSTFYLTETMLVVMQAYVKTAIETEVQCEGHGYDDDTENMTPDSNRMVTKEIEGESMASQGPLDSLVNHKRKRCISDGSLVDIDTLAERGTLTEIDTLAESGTLAEGGTQTDTQASSQITTGKISKNKKTRRKLIKGVSIAAWAVFPPIMIGVNLLRERPKEEDDDDEKRDDPLRPWNFDVNYVRSHKR